MVQTDTLQYQCKGVIYYFLSTLLLALTFFCYIIGSTILPVMDVMGWLFFVLSCLSCRYRHALAPCGLCTSGPIAATLGGRSLVCDVGFPVVGVDNAQSSGLSTVSIPHQRHYS